jgi:hypothetical protein
MASNLYHPLTATFFNYFISLISSVQTPVQGMGVGAPIRADRTVAAGRLKDGIFGLFQDLGRNFPPHLADGKMRKAYLHGLSQRDTRGESSAMMNF